jgi:hypothetical protein
VPTLRRGARRLARCWRYRCSNQAGLRRPGRPYGCWPQCFPLPLPFPPPCPWPCPFCEPGGQGTLPWPPPYWSLEELELVCPLPGMPPVAAITPPAPPTRIPAATSTLTSRDFIKGPFLGALACARRIASVLILSRSKGLAAGRSSRRSSATCSRSGGRRFPFNCRISLPITHVGPDS